MKYWNEHFECMPREEIRILQSRRLQKLVDRVYNNVPHYREKMIAAGVEPGDIRTVDDIVKLPFTVKQDLRDTYPFGMFAVPMSDINRIHASSGTTGKQTVVGYTARDLDIWAECMARSLTGAGATRSSIVHVAYGYGLFTGGLGAHYGAEKIGCAVIPVSSGNTARQVTILKDFKPDYICCTPSYALYLAEELYASGGSSADIHLKAGLFGAEPWTEEMRSELESKLGIKALDIYGLSEIMGPSVSCECLEQCGMHVQEDHFLIEIINPETGIPVKDGEQGEVVFTTLTKEGFPLIRYRTRDLSYLMTEPCACGRTTARMHRLCGRTDDMLIVRGVNVFPSQIETVLMNKGYAANYQIIVDRVNNSDTIEVQVEMTPEMFSDSMSEVTAKEKELVTALKAMLGIYAKVTLVNPKTITRSEGKAVRVIDKRNLYK